MSGESQGSIHRIHHDLGSTENEAFRGNESVLQCFAAGDVEPGVGMMPHTACRRWVMRQPIERD